MTRRHNVMGGVVAGVLLLLAALALKLEIPTDAAGAAIVTVAVATGIVVAFAAFFEGSVLRARELAVIALLGALAALLRVPFAAVPGLQPSTYLIVCSGYVFGPVPGFVVGALTALVSNFFLGHGPWTLFQVVGWGLAGASAPLLRSMGKRVWALVAFGVVWGVLFGVISNFWTWTAFVYPLTMRTFLITWLNSIWFDVLHAAGNAFFLALFGVKTIRILERYRRRFTWVRAAEDGSRTLPHVGRM